MVRDTFEQIKQGNDIRQNLIELKASLKEGFHKSALLYHIGKDYSIFYQLLLHEDAKVRKNTALIMGELGVSEFSDKLYEAYKKETQLFVKSSYLTALKGLDYAKYIKELKERLEQLSSAQVEEGNKKHINEEIRVLSELILAVEGIKQHEFTGYEVNSQCILLTNRNFQDVTLKQVKEKQAKVFNAGVMVKTGHLKEILSIRTYSELLFVLEDLRTLGNDLNQSAKAVADSSLVEFMGIRHSGEAPYLFRIELKSRMDMDKRSAYTKKLGMEIERLSGRKLINSTSNYEVEIRLIENKEGNYNVLIKLFTLKDSRFSYRKQTTATSLAPVNAALLSALSKKYLKEGAQVLDPFCGVGTLLIERNNLVPAGDMYGLDTFKEAVDKARANTGETKAFVHYINRDFFDFKHEYLFDEIITDLPRALGHKEEQEIVTLYRKFFQKASEHLNKNGILILYTHNKEYIKKFMNPSIYKKEEELEISKKEGAYLYILRYLG